MTDILYYDGRCSLCAREIARLEGTHSRRAAQAAVERLQAKAHAARCARLDGDGRLWPLVIRLLQ